MKIKSLPLAILAFSSVSAIQAAVVSVPLTNWNFEDGGSAFPGGFDIVGNDVAGWTDYGTITDAGVEANTAWWGTYDNSNSVFMAPGNGAANVSSYAIQSGDEFQVVMYGKSWSGSSVITLTVYYDDPSNVIGTYTTPVTGDWTPYVSPVFEAPPAAVGGSVGVTFLNATGDTNFASIDNVALIPEPSTSLIMALGSGALFARRRRRS